MHKNIRCIETSEERRASKNGPQSKAKPIPPVALSSFFFFSALKNGPLSKAKPIPPVVLRKYRIGPIFDICDQPSRNCLPFHCVLPRFLRFSCILLAFYKFLFALLRKQDRSPAGKTQKKRLLQISHPLSWYGVFFGEI